MRLPMTLAACLAALPANADRSEDFVSANVLGIFYHELGHAIIDTEGLPIFGQEEDAADILSIFLIDAFFEEDTAQAIAHDVANGFLHEAEARGDTVPWWDEHGPDEQRFYNTVCIFYGARPKDRQDLAEDLGLPDERAERCLEEYDQAADSWGTVLFTLEGAGPGDTLRFDGATGTNATLAESILAAEVAELNASLSLSVPLTVVYADCGEVNAFYDPEYKEITFCSEYEDYLFELADGL